MPALHVVIQPRPDRAPHPSLASVYGLFDVVVDGVNITARIGEVEAMTLLCDFAQAFLRLMGSRPRQTLQLQAELESWEIGLEADGNDVLLTVFRERPVATVAVWERRVGQSELFAALTNALDELCTSPGARSQLPAAVRSNLNASRRALQQCALFEQAPRGLLKQQLELLGDAQFRLGASALLRDGRAAAASGSSRLEKADLHALLCQGTLSFGMSTQKISAEGSQLFLDSEQLLGLCEQLWGSVEAGRPIFRRAALSRSILSLRWGPDSERCELRVRASGTASGKEKTLFSEPSARVLCTTVASFAERLCSSWIACDPSQAQNLRLKALQQQAEQLRERSQEHPDDAPLTNPDPGSYRLGASGARQRKPGMWDQGGKMRFLPRWVATVPSIDLTSTFLCGDRLVIGSHRETACLDRQSGSILWRQVTPRASCVVSPSGLLRIEADGHLSCLDLANGETRFEAQLSPRPGAGHSGSVVETPGLPRLFAVTEGDRQVTALDLASGSLRWRYTAPRSTLMRTRRAGKLLLIAGRDPTLVALDLATGEVVWRVRRPLPFTGEIALHKDSIFALTGAAGGRWTLLHINAWTGDVLWESELDEKPVLGRLPVVTSKVVAIPSRDEMGTGLRGYDRETGKLLWEHGSHLAAPSASWLAVDDCILGNTAAGVLLCLDAATGTPRYSHVFSSSAGGDQPRRLEPILRSGALFVPQQQVHVLRPRDGEVLGTLPSDLIPDLIRVDERCDVYVCEESGHVAAFSAATKLTLVK